MQRTQGQLLKFMHRLRHGLFITSLVQLLTPFMNVSQNIPLGPNKFQTFNSAYCKELRREEDNIGVVVTASSMVGPLRQHVWLAHGFPWSVMKEEVELQEVEQPPGLSSIELFCCHKVLEVFVVHPYLELVFGAFDE